MFMIPQLALQVAVAVAESCRISLTTIVGLAGSIEKANPLPLSGTDCGLFRAVSVNINVAVRVPIAVGVNAMLTLQFAEPARVVPHVWLEIAKSAAPEMAMLDRLMAEEAPLLNVTDCAALVVPTVVLAKLREAGITLAAGWLPVPDNVTVCGLFPAESVNVRVAMRAPATEGVNAMFTVQLPEPARVAPHVLLEMAKSAAPVPEIMMLLMLRAVEPPLLSVTDCGELVEPMIVAVNVRLAGVTLALGRLPVPDSSTVCGLFAAESTNVRMAVRGPAAEGVNKMVTVQLAETARLVPHVFPEMAKSGASVPEVAIVPMVIDVDVPLLNVTD